MIETRFDSNLQDELISEYIKLLDAYSSLLLISRDKSVFDKFKSTGKNFQTCLLNDNDSYFDSQSEILNISEKNFNSLQTKKFHKIILFDVLEYSQNSSVFLSNIKNFLDNDGKIISSVFNITNIINRIKFLDNDFNNSLFNSQKKISTYTLDDLLILFSNSDLSLDHLVRLKKEISLSNQNEIKNFVIPKELFESLLLDHECSTFFYIFELSPGTIVQPFVRKWISGFSKNIVTEMLKSLLEDLENSHKKKIEYQIQTNREQYAIIKHLEKALSEKDEYIANIIKDKDKHYQDIIDAIIRDKDAYAEQIIRDKDAYAEQIIKDKDTQLEEIKQSTAFRILRSIDKLRGKSENN